MKKEVALPPISNSVALFILTLHCHPEVLDAFKSKGEVPRAFAKLDAQALADVRRYVKTFHDDGCSVCVSAA